MVGALGAKENEIDLGTFANAGIEKLFSGLYGQIGRALVRPCDVPFPDSGLRLDFFHFPFGKLGGKVLGGNYFLRKRIFQSGE